MTPPPRPAPPYAGLPTPADTAGGHGKKRNAKVPLLVGGAVAAIAAVAGITLLLTGGEDDNRRRPPVSTTTTTEDPGSALPAPEDSPAWSGEPALYLLGQQCFEGALEACDSLYFDSPVDSADEAYGSTCGQRNDEVNGFCVERYQLPGAAPPGVLGDDPALNALTEGCANGDLNACDDLYSDSAIDSAYETYGSTCGGRNEEVDGSCVERYQPGAESPATADLDALAESCFDGELDACDDLYSNSPVDSAHETYGSTCGGRNEEVDGSCVERYDDG